MAEIREVRINIENIISRVLIVLLSFSFFLFFNENKNLKIQSKITNPNKISDKYKAAEFHSIKCPSILEAPVSKTWRFSKGIEKMNK